MQFAFQRRSAAVDGRQPIDPSAVAPCRSACNCSRSGCSRWSCLGPRLRYVQEMEAALRSGLERSLLASATTVAAALEGQDVGLCLEPHCAAPHVDAATTIYAAPLARPPASTVRVRTGTSPTTRPSCLAGGHRVWVGVNGRFVFVFAAVRDDQRGVPASARCRTATGSCSRRRPAPAVCGGCCSSRARLACFARQETAPEVCSLPTEAFDDRVLERLARDRDGLLGRNAHSALARRRGARRRRDRRRPERAQTTTCELAATWNEATRAPGALSLPAPRAARACSAQFSRTGGRFRVLDPDGWVLSDAGRVEPRIDSQSARGSLSAPSCAGRCGVTTRPIRPSGRSAALVTPMLRSALAGEPTTAWYGSEPDREAIVAAAVPIAGPARAAGRRADRASERPDSHAHRTRRS